MRIIVLITEAATVRDILGAAERAAPAEKPEAVTGAGEKQDPCIDSGAPRHCDQSNDCLRGH